MKRKQKGSICIVGSAWTVRFWEPQNVDGTVIRKRISNKIREAIPRELRQWEKSRTVPADVKDIAEEIAHARKVRDNSVEQPLMTVREFVENTFLPDVELRCRLATSRRYRSNWELHLSRAILRNVERQPSFADFPLSRVATKHAQTVLTEVIAQGAQRRAPELRLDESGKARKVRPLTWEPLNSNSMACMKTTLSAIFSEAIRLGLHPGGNPVGCARIEYNSVPKAEEDQPFYSLEQIEKMLNVIPPPANVALAIAAYAGLRLGEIEGLLWENIVDEGGGPMIKVEQTLWRGRVQPPKSKASKASVPVIPQLAFWLDQHRARMGDPVAGPVLSNGLGRYTSLSNLVSRVILPVLNRCLYCGKQEGVPHIGHEYVRDPRLPKWCGWHAARRGLSSNLVSLGASDLQASRMLRHSNVTVTRKHYIMTTEADRIRTMAILEKGLSDRQAKVSGLFGTLDVSAMTPPKSIN